MTYRFITSHTHLATSLVWASMLTPTKKGANFEEEYIHLLRDTASMTTEDLAKKHLNVDLTQPDFWQAGIDMVTEDIQTFMELTEEFI